MRTCAKCGAAIPSDAQTCSGCGFVIEPAVVASDQSHPKSVRVRIMTTTNIKNLIRFLVLGSVLLWAMVSCHEQYQVFVVKKFISEPILAGSAARSEITDFYKKHKRLPRDAAEAGVDLADHSQYVERVYYEAGRGEIHIVVRRIAPEVDGKSIVMRAIPGPTELYGGSCGSYDIPLKYLPGSCRESFRP